MYNNSVIKAIMEYNDFNCEQYKTEEEIQAMNKYDVLEIYCEWHGIGWSYREDLKNILDNK